MKHNGFQVDIHKTEVIPVDSDSHGLPPSRGAFQNFMVADWHCPPEWSKDGFFIPVEEGQPMWFDLRWNDECACLPSIQRLNPITGEPSNLDAGLNKEPVQNYLCLPEQKWLDGYAKDGKVYQFVVTKEGIGLAVNEYVLPKYMQDSHALAFVFYGAKNPKKKDEFTPIFAKKRASIHYFSSIHTPENWVAHGDFDIHKVYRSYSVGNTAHEPASAVITACCTPMATDRSQIASNNLIDNAEVKCCSGIKEADCCVDGIQESEIVSSHDEIDVVDILKGQDDIALDKASMGMGGRITQRIISDKNSIDYYRDKPDAIVTVYLALPGIFQSIMEKGQRQNENKKDKYVHSGEIAGVQVPLISQS
jgi:hypothetical protein